MTNLHVALVKLVLAIWSVSGHSLPKDAPVIADAIVTVTLDAAASGKPPVLGSYNEDIAAQAYWAEKESSVRLHPGHWVDPRTGKEVDPIAQGPFQTHRLGPDATAIEYARDWRRQLRDGAKVCPESPLAPLSGSCHLARPLADRRVREARALLVKALAATDDRLLTASESPGESSTPPMQ